MQVVSVATEHEKTMCFRKQKCQILDKASLSLLLLKWRNFTISNVELMVCTACVVCMQRPKLKSQKKRNGIKDLDI